MNQKFVADAQGYLEVPEICRGGRLFVFQIGINTAKLDPLMRRVKDAYARFASIPLQYDVADTFNEKILVSAIYATNKIEGGPGEAETEQVLNALKPGSTRRTFTEQQRSIINLKQAFGYLENLEGGLLSYLNSSRDKSNPLQIIQETHIKTLNQLIMTDLTLSNGGVPGHYRNGKVHVSDDSHGGTYEPPICYDDINTLMKAFVAWSQSLALQNLSELYAAPLFHYYFELIHPFPDGNGRVGRFLEAMVLLAANHHYSAYAIWQYYNEHIDEYYSLLNHCRKAAKENQPYPNTAFVEFFLKGMLITINRLHDQANQMISKVLHNLQLNHLLVYKFINKRQYALFDLLKTILESFPDIPYTREALNHNAQYIGLYAKLSKQTKSRDLHKLQELNLITIHNHGEIVLTDANSAIKLSTHPDTQPL